MQVKIVKGGYGCTPMLPNGKKSRYIVPIPEGTVVDVDDAEALNLIDSGFAAYVDDPVQIGQDPSEKSENTDPPKKKNAQKKAQTSKDVTD